MTDVVRAGWSKTRIPLGAEARVLDLGSGAFPNPRADFLCDWSLWHDRGGKAPLVDRPFVIADALALPFRRLAFDLVIASHIAEHVEDPAALCSELTRVSKAGYIETPSPSFDRLFHESGHLWRVRRRRGTLRFQRKRARRRLSVALTEPIYRLYYAGEETERPTLRMPGGLLGRLLRALQYLLKGVLNRSGLIHTRYRFGPEKPLSYIVESSDRTDAITSDGGRQRR